MQTLSVAESATLPGKCVGIHDYTRLYPTRFQVVPSGKSYPAYLFALTGNFYSTGPVSPSDIAKKMALFHAHFVS